MYTIEWFKEKFSNIKEEEIRKYSLVHRDGGHCALGHCGVREGSQLMGNYIQTEESKALGKIFRIVFPEYDLKDDSILVFHVNDGTSLKIWDEDDHLIKTFYTTTLGATPKERILKVLEMAEELENKELMEANVEFVREELTAELV